MLATAANAMWQVAKLNQYDKFIPWSATDPITAEDAREWLVANPSLSPTVNDFIAPAVPCGLRFNSTPGAGLAKLNVAIPASEAHKNFLEQGHDRHSKPDPKPELEFAEAPDIGAPDLEDIPTAEIILAPLLNLMSDLKNFSVPSHTAVCPIASFTALGKEYQLRAHCELIEQHRALIEAAMSLAWAITALFIVLRA